MIKRWLQRAETVAQIVRNLFLTFQSLSQKLQFAHFIIKIAQKRTHSSPVVSRSVWFKRSVERNLPQSVAHCFQSSRKCSIEYASFFKIRQKRCFLCYTEKRHFVEKSRHSALPYFRSRSSQFAHCRREIEMGRSLFTRYVTYSSSFLGMGTFFRATGYHHEIFFKTKLIKLVFIISIGLFLFLSYAYFSNDFALANNSLRKRFCMQGDIRYDNRSYIDVFSETVSFERRHVCNVNGEELCHFTNKSLVMTFWNEKSKSYWMAQNILSAFPSHSFDHLIFVYDNSTWHSHPGYDQFIWIHVHGQIRFWYVKRFLTPSMIRSYKYIWIIDDDSRLNFVPLHYQCVVEHLQIPLSAPGRLTGALSHPITKVNERYKARVGRWTDFVETGPVFVATSRAWLCIYRYLSASTGSGWEIDAIWCHILADRCLPKSDRRRVCAILDAFGLEHQSETINSAGYGSPEAVFYQDRFYHWRAGFQTYGPLASDRSLVDSCNKSRWQRLIAFKMNYCFYAFLKWTER